MISEDDVAEILRDSESLDDAAQKLIDAANANGGRDNITVVLFRLDEDDPTRDEDHDTLGDQATPVGISADEVRAAVADARARRPSQRTVPAKTMPADVPEDEHTMALSRRRGRRGAPARQPRRRRGRPASRSSTSRASEPRSRSASRRAPPRRRGRSRFRTVLTAAIVLAMIAALLVGAQSPDRLALLRRDQRRRPRHALQRRALRPSPRHRAVLRGVRQPDPRPHRCRARNRERILDHQLRSKGDATDLVRQIERGRIEN